MSLSVTDDVIGDAPIHTRKRDCLTSERFGEAQRVGDAITLFLGVLQAASAFDVKSGPWAMQAICQSFRIANESRRTWILADTDQDALACRPWSRNSARLHLREQLLIDPFCCSAQRELTERG